MNEKNNEYQKKWYENNKQLQIERNKVNKQKKIDWYEEYKSGMKCCLCGEVNSDCIDLVKDGKKISDMVSVNLGFGRIKEAAKDAKPVCKNCSKTIKSL